MTGVDFSPPQVSAQPMYADDSPPVIEYRTCSISAVQPLEPETGLALNSGLGFGSS